MDQKKIGLFLRELRKEKNLTQEQLAVKCGVTNKSVSRWENGTNMPDLDILIMLADFYEIDLREILEGERRIEKTEMDWKETVEQAADYNRLKEKTLLRKILMIVLSGCIAWGISLITMFLFVDNVTGGIIVLGISLVCMLLYFLLTMVWQSNRTATGYLNCLIGGFTAVTVGNISLLLLFFSEGTYKNYGIVGLWYTVFLIAGIFLLTGLAVTWINRKTMLQNK